jgi:hypothetical protein
VRILLISANTEKINILPIPLGLNYVAGAAQHKGHDVRVLDLMTHADSRVTISEGRISPNNSLLAPAFYMVEEIED